MKLKITILVPSCSILVLALETDPILQKNKLQFCHGINYTYEGYLSHSIDRIYVVMKFQLPS